MNSVVIGSSSMSGVLGTPAIDSNNTLYFGTEDGYLVATNTSGELLWETTLDASIRSSVAIDEMNGLLYIGTKDDEKSKLIALAISSGELQWEYEPGGDVYSSPSIGDNGRIYVGSESRYLHAFDSTGEEVWKVHLSQDITWPSPTIDSKGIIYLGGMGGKIYAIQTDCTGLMPGPWSKIHQNNQNTGF
jgi:outer membrane protein assembly factor BamB